MSKNVKKLDPKVRRHYDVVIDFIDGRLVLQDFSQDGHKGSQLFLVLLQKAGFRVDVTTDSPCG
ncbi:hypothetical protein HN643_00165 [Candidatus Falkowbacteria bacterium]|nr:hypothetical protein [Candidatus Falkowbacteria bacterium]